MQLKVIDKDKVKILIEDKDFEQMSVPDDVTDCNQLAVREFILKLLNETYVQTGIDFLNSKILIEVVPGAALSFYIIITRLCVQNTASDEFSLKADEDMYLFELYYTESIFDVSAVVEKAICLKIGASKMYKYKNKFYLTVNFPPETVSDPAFYDLIKEITEYSFKCRWNILNEAILCEWGELIMNEPLGKLSRKK